MLPFKKDIMNIREIAKKLAIEYRLPRADRYDLYLRDFDGMVEVLGWMQDPTANMNDYRGREMLFPKRWVTIGVLPGETRVNV
jgi:hypothetical protein